MVSLQPKNYKNKSIFKCYNELGDKIDKKTVFNFLLDELSVFSEKNGRLNSLDATKVNCSIKNKKYFLGFLTKMYRI